MDAKDTSFGIEQAHLKRDRRLRRRILQVLDAAKVGEGFGWCSGRFIFDVVDGALPGGQQFEQGNDDHLAALLRDLIGSNYIDERDDRTRKWQHASMDVMSYRILPLGTALVQEAIDPDPLIEDDRTRTSEPRRGGGGARR